MTVLSISGYHQVGRITQKVGADRRGINQRPGCTSDPLRRPQALALYRLHGASVCRAFQRVLHRRDISRSQSQSCAAQLIDAFDKLVKPGALNHFFDIPRNWLLRVSAPRLRCLLLQ